VPIKLASEFVPRAPSRHRLAMAFDLACPTFARWCDDANNELTRKQLVDQFEESWRSALELRLPHCLQRASAHPVRYRSTQCAVILRVVLELDAMERDSPKADLALKVICRPVGGTVAFDPAGKLLPQIRDGDWQCSVVARICDAGRRRGVVFYRGMVNAELAMG
jgi:hypothetical protein